MAKTNDVFPDGESPRGLRRDLLPTSPRSIQPGIARAPVEEESAISITPAFVLRSLAHWWKLATLCGLGLTVGACALVWYTFVPVYKAGALVQIQTPVQIVANVGGDSSPQFIRTQIEMMKSNFLLGRALARPEIASLPELQTQMPPVEWMKKNIKTQATPGTDLITIQYEGGNAENGAKLVNAVLDTYLEIHDEDNSRRTHRVIELMASEKDKFAAEVRQLRSNIRELAKQARVPDPFEKGVAPAPNPTLAPLAALGQHLSVAEIARQEAEADLTAHQEEIDKPNVVVPLGVIEHDVDSFPEVAVKKAELVALRSRLRDTESVSAKGKDDPNCLKYRAQIERNEQALSKLRASLAEQVKADRTASMIGKRKDDLQVKQEALVRLRLREKILRDNYENAKKQVRVELSDGNSNTIELEFARDEHTRRQNMLSMIGDRMLALQADTRAPSRVIPLERATPATAPVEAIPFTRIALAAAVALFLPFALAVTWEKVVRRVGDSVQLRRDTHLRVIGEIAALPTRPHVAQGAARGPARRDISLFEESIDSLRTSLVLSEDIGDLQVIAVTSAISGEGKTSLSSQLALSISRASGEPTLLIDADMRSPDIHKVFQVAQEPGLAQVLDRQCSAQDAIVTGWSRNLHILPAGKLGKSPHKLLGAGVLPSVLEELRATYRYIIIDTPPVLSASEALVFSKAAEGVLICTMRDVSRVRQVKLACDRLVAANARPIGAVLNGVPTNHYAYTYGTYSYRRA